MQTASDNFAAAMSGYSGVWLAPQVSADWDGDGYGSTGSIDDLSQVAGRIQVSQAFDDGMPDDVTYTSSSDPTSTASVDLAGRDGLSPKAYWSTFNDSSPVAAYDRDVAPVTISHGAVTNGGPERVTVFTGRMSDTPVDGSAASLTAVSATRQAMSASVQPPPIWADAFGLTATWPVSWALVQCGIYASPPPRPGCRLWMPMHGSIQPFLPAQAMPFGHFYPNYATTDLRAGSADTRPTFTTGPFVSGLYGSINSQDAKYTVLEVLPVADGDDLFSQRASAGRVEFWVRGDAADLNSTPVASGSLPFAYIKVLIGNTGGTNGFVLGGVNTSRKPYLTINDGAGHSTNLTAAAAIPSDGLWHFVGLAWDVAGKKMWLNADGVATNSALSSHVTTSLTETNNFDLYQLPANGTLDCVNIEMLLPTSEWQVTGGAQANPDNYPWISSTSYWDSATAGADIRSSQLNMVGLAELKAREAWEFIASFAQAELAMIRTTETDKFAYYPMSWLAETAQQTAQQALSTSTNLGDSLALKRDPTTIRNQVTVNYLAAVAVGAGASARATIHDDFTVRALPPGVTTFTMQTDIATLAVDILNDPFYVITASEVSSGVGPVRNYICANSSTDGAGSYASSTTLIARVTGFTVSTVTVEVTNNAGTTYYTVNSSSLPFLHIVGLALVTGDATQIVQSDDSIATRGVRGLTLDVPEIQDAQTATSIAGELLARLARPRVSAEATVRGDPRRQPGDLVTIADPTGTKAAGTWRLATVDHDINGADYTQDITATQAALIGVWDSSTWDGCIWG